MSSLLSRRGFGAGLLGAGLAGWSSGARAAGLLAQAAPAAQPRFFRIGTGSTSGTYFPIGTLLGSVISKPAGSRDCERGGSCGVEGLIAAAQATNGSVDNVRGIAAGTLESGLCQANIAYWAYTGTRNFDGQRPLEELRAIASLYRESIHLVVRAESAIRSVRDLRGRRVAVGDRGSGTLVDTLFLLDAFGLKESDLLARYLMPGPAADALARNEIDCFSIIAGFPTAAVQDLAEQVPIRLLSLSDGDGDAFVRSHPFFAFTRIPEGTYKDVPAAETLSVGAQWLTSSRRSAELIHGILTALWHPSSRRILDSGHPEGRNIRLETALSGLAIPLHEGAERFYREKGML
ncbi:MAG: TAXI family TRAP transporter solute-binding subunit [Thalassobaculales bacterium]